MRAARLVLLGLLALGIAAVALASRGAATDPPMADFGMEGSPALLADIRTDFNVMESGSVLPMRVIVVDVHGVPVAGASVRVGSDGATISPTEGTTNGDGVFRFTVTAGATSVTRRISITALATFAGAVPDTDVIDVTVVRAGPTAQVLPQREAVSVGIGALVLGAALSTEIGRYGAFKLLVFPLYSRLKKEEVLDHFVRGQIYGYIVSHPGQHYNLMRQDLKVTNGTLAHHLRTLEMMGFVKSARDGIFKRFYPIEMMVPQDRGVKLSDLQLQILDLIRRGSGPTQAEIAGSLGVTQQTVSYNLRALGREGAVRMEKDGRNARYYPPAA